MSVSFITCQHIIILRFKGNESNFVLLWSIYAELRLFVDISLRPPQLLGAAKISSTADINSRWRQRVVEPVALICIGPEA